MRKLTFVGLLFLLSAGVSAREIVKENTAAKTFRCICLVVLDIPVKAHIIRCNNCRRVWRREEHEDENREYNWVTKPIYRVDKED